MKLTGKVSAQRSKYKINEETINGKLKVKEKE